MMPHGGEDTHDSNSFPRLKSVSSYDCLTLHKMGLCKINDWKECDSSLCPLRAFGKLKVVSSPESFSDFDDAEPSLILLENKEALEWGHRGVPVYVQCYSTTNFLGLADWLKRFDEKLGSEVDVCGKSWVKYYCKGGGGHLLLKPKLCRHRHFCPNDAEAYTRLRVNRAYEVLSEFVSKLRLKTYLIHFVFTLPKPLWEKAVENPNLLVKAVYKTLDEYRGMKGGVLAVHFTHSKNPLMGWYPHVHVLLLNVVAKVMPQICGDGLKLVRRKKEGKVFFVRKRPFFNHVFLKMRYKWWIKEFFGYEWVGFPDVYVQYVRFEVKNEVKIKHLLRYAFRLPIQDFSEVDFSKLTQEQSNFVWNLLKLRFKRIRWFGFLADGVKKFYFSFVDLDYVRIEVILWKYRIKSSLCPVHGCKMICLGGWDYG